MRSWKVAQMNPETAKTMKQTPLYKLYPEVNWEVLFTKLNNLLKPDYDWSNEVAKIKSPLMMVFADADGVRMEHITEFFGLFGGGQRDAGLDGSGRPNASLAILPGMTHYNLISFPALASIINIFLDVPKADYKLFYD